MDWKQEQRILDTLDDIFNDEVEDLEQKTWDDMIARGEDLGDLSYPAE